MLSWSDALFDVARRLLATRFYQGVVEATQAYLSLDEQVLADVAETLSEEGACNPGCLSDCA